MPPSPPTLPTAVPIDLTTDLPVDPLDMGPRPATGPGPAMGPAPSAGRISPNTAVSKFKLVLWLAHAILNLQQSHCHV
jgi:hypothetical protein